MIFLSESAMKLSLSVRIVEARCKTKLFVPFEEVVSIAAETGYDAICMRASAGGINTRSDQLQSMRDTVGRAGLRVSMVTADSKVPLNTDDGPDSLRDIGPSLDVAESLQCDLIRVCLKTSEDIAFAKEAADRAAERGIRLAHQCHTSSMFEQVEPMLQVLRQIGRPNFGVIYEPANLMLCGQTYGEETLRALQPWLLNAYFQNHILDPDGPEALPTFCRGTVRYGFLDPWEAGGVDVEEMLQGFRAINYDGYLTIHQAQGIQDVDGAKLFARQCAEFFRGECS